MIADFAIATPDFGGDVYTAIDYMASNFLRKLSLLIEPFGYRVVEDGDWVTDEYEAKKLKLYCRDFRLDNAEGRSREFRIYSKLSKSAWPEIGVLNETKASKKGFRDKDPCKPGKSYFLGWNTEVNVRGSNTLKAVKLRTLTAKSIYYFRVVVNEDMILVFGGSSLHESAACVYMNYLSFIRLFSLYKTGRVTWASNGLISLSDKEALCDMPIQSERGYALIGTLLKMGENRTLPLEWIAPRVLVLPRITAFARRPVDEDFTVFFTDDHNDRSENRIYHLDTIQGLKTKPCIVLI